MLKALKEAINTLMRAKLHRDCRQSEDLTMLLYAEEECGVLGLVSEISKLVQTILLQYFLTLRTRQ